MKYYDRDDDVTQCEHLVETLPSAFGILIRTQFPARIGNSQLLALTAFIFDFLRRTKSFAGSQRKTSD